MRGKAEFSLLGRVGKITVFKGVTKVSIASDYSSKDERGEWRENTYWNTVSVFSEKTIEWIEKGLNPGDLVNIDGRLRESSYQKEGKDVHTVDLVAQTIILCASKRRHDSSDNQDEAA